MADGQRRSPSEHPRVEEHRPAVSPAGVPGRFRRRGVLERRPPGGMRERLDLERRHEADRPEPAALRRSWRTSCNFYHWAAYDDPKLLKEFTAEFGPATTIDVYNSTEEAIAKLVAAAGTSGYDIDLPHRDLHPADESDWTFSKSSTSPGSRTSRTSTLRSPTSHGIRTTSTPFARTGVPPGGSTTPR